MDAVLKEQITKFALLTLEHLRVRGSKVTLEMLARKTRFSGRENPQILASRDLKRRLADRSLVKRCREEMFEDGLLALLVSLARKQAAPGAKAEISAARARQLDLFPGYDHLPTRIRKGRNFLTFPEVSVAQFLAYEERYQVREQRNSRVADELHRLAQILRPLKADYPDMPLAMAFSRAQAEAPALAVVTKRG